MSKLPHLTIIFSYIFTLVCTALKLGGLIHTSWLIITAPVLAIAGLITIPILVIMISNKFKRIKDYKN
jgi:hypothetical protein